MTSEVSTGECDNEKMPGGTGKLQRSVSSMMKQMEMTDEEMKYRMENFENAEIGKQYLKYLKCTKCNLNFQNIINKGKTVGVHPLLGVLLCQSCCDYYGDGNFSLDSEGEDKYCRWCGQGGTIFACSRCICGFCEECIRKHFGKQSLEDVKNDDDWVCYFCNPRPLWYLRSICSLAKEAAKSKRQHLEYLKDGRSLRKKKSEDAPNTNSSDNCSSATDSINKKQVNRRRFSKHGEKAKRESSSTSEEGENVKIVIVKKKRKAKKKSGRNTTEESSGSDSVTPKKRVKLAEERNGDSELEKIRSPLLEKLKSIWKLTQTTTEIGLKSSRERLLNLSKAGNFSSMESLKREHEELKSCISVLVSTLGVVSNSADSIGEDLKFDNAKDEREIFQSQESKLKRFAKRFEEESNVETSFEVDRDAPSKVDLVEEKRKEKEETGKERRRKEKSVKESTGEGENGAASGSQSEPGREDSGEGVGPSKPLLKVKSFARMLDDNVYDKEKETKSVNGECKASEKVSEKASERASERASEKASERPVVIDLYEMDTEESECEFQKKKGSFEGDKGKSGSSEEGDKKKEEEEEEGNSLKTHKASHIENGECNDGEETEKSNQRAITKCGVKRNGRKTRKQRKKARECGTEDDKKGETENESGTGETVIAEARKKDADEKKNETSEEGAEKENPSEGKTDEPRPSKDEEEKNKKAEDGEEKNSESENETEKADKKPTEKNEKSDFLSRDDSSSEEKNTRRLTRKKKEKQELKASFEEFKQKRQTFLNSGKDNSESKGERRKVCALDSSDSEGERKEKTSKQKKRVLTSSDEASEKEAKRSEASEDEQSDKEHQKPNSEVKMVPSSETSSDEMTARQRKRKRVRRKRNSDSSDNETKTKRKGKDNNSESSGEDLEKKNKGRRNIKKILKKDSLQMETKEALKSEQERKKRLKERQKLFDEVFPQQQDSTQLKHLVLDFDPQTKEPLVTVHKKLVKKLKPHQAKGVKFMWDNCFESVQRMEEDSGSGCILAHCMGLGKTLQVITLVHTIMTHELGVNTVLIVCPLSTVSNWLREFEMWLANIHTDPITLYDIIKYKKAEDRRFYLRDWQQSGGVLVTSYDLFRNLTKGFAKKKKSQSQKVFESALVDPGPDLVICDEGHLLKNEGTALSKCMSRVKTSRRIILTGTPLQNNLIEYHCMVQFVKPNILGTKKEFMNRFVNPINNGQFEDSTEMDVKIMKRRSHVLHSMLDGCIQRFDYSVLTPFLPEKHEYVLSIGLTDTQAKLYVYFMGNLSQKSLGCSRTASLFNDYHSLQRIWTHPRTMLMHSERETLRDEVESEGSLKDFIVSSDEESQSSRSDTSNSSACEVVPPKRVTRSNANNPEVLEALEEENAATKNWWDEFYDEKAYDDLRESNKLVLLFALLKHCSKLNDKVLVFSQSLYSLDLIEYFLARINENRDEDCEPLCGHKDTWLPGSDYFRLDGSTSSEKRTAWCNYFNEESNTRARLFLLSTKAGGLGINLYGANRVIIFDASWNPSHDLQSIFRVYRFGQKKTCYVYRFLSEATMEEKIYERQVTKLSLARRVVDEHQIERHYTMGNLQALYTFEPTPKHDRQVPILPKDPVLADLLAAHKDLIVGYHEHDSLLENKEEEELSEEERKAAWKEYEEEKVQKVFGFDPTVQQQMLLLMQQARLSQGATAPQEFNSMFLYPTNPGQAIINPVFLQTNQNIPLAVQQRGLKVGLAPAANESLESYFLRIFNKESWLMSGGQQ